MRRMKRGLYVVETKPPAETPAAAVRKRLKATRQPAILQCTRCEGREMLETVTGAGLINGKLQGGSRAILCATCHRNGERVVVA